MKSTALYVLANDFREAATRLMEYDLDEQTIKDTLEGLSGELEVKATNVAMLAKNLEASAQAIKVAAKEQLARAKALEAQAENIQRYLFTCMKMANISRIECPFFVLAIKKNPKSVVIDDEAQIPDEFMRQPEAPPPEPDKKLIKEMLDHGVNVSWAHLDQAERLEIK